MNAGLHWASYCCLATLLHTLSLFPPLRKLLYTFTAFLSSPPQRHPYSVRELASHATEEKEAVRRAPAISRAHLRLHLRPLPALLSPGPTPHLQRSPGTHASPLTHWRTSLYQLFSLLMVLSICPLALPFPLVCKSATISLIFEKISLTSYPIPVIASILCSWWSKTLDGGICTCLQFPSFHSPLNLPRSSFRHDQASAHTIPTIINYQSSACLIYHQNWTKLIIPLCWKHILPFVSRTIFSFIPTSPTALY